MQIDLNKVAHVYSGKKGRCMCGCSGKHTYAKKYQDWGTNYRGYTVHNDECSDRTVKMITNKINCSTNQEIDGEWVSAVIGERIYVAYLVA